LSNYFDLLFILVTFLMFFYFCNVFYCKNVSKKIQLKTILNDAVHHLLQCFLLSTYRQKTQTGSINRVLRAHVAEMSILFDTFTLMLFLYVSLTLVHRVKTCMY